MNKDTKKWFFNLDERIDRIDAFYNERIKKLEDKVDDLDINKQVILEYLKHHEALLENKMEDK